MSSKNDRYRNPPAPLGYICKAKPDIIRRNSISLDDINCKFIDFIIDSGILDVPDCSIYDDFIPNSSSEDDEIIEVPVETRPKTVETVDIEAENVVEPQTEKDIPVTIKKEIRSEESLASSEISKDVEENAKISTSPKPKKITVKEELFSHKNEKIISEKNIKKHDRKRSSHKKKSNNDSDNDYYSRKNKHKIKDACNEYDNSSKSHKKSKKSKHRRKDNESDSSYSNEYVSDSKSHKKSKKIKHRKIDNESDSSYSNEYVSDSKSHSRKNKHRNKDSESDSCYSKRSDHRRTEGFYIDTNPCTSRDDYRREDFTSDTSSYSRDIYLKREPGYYSDDSDSSLRKVMGRQRTPSPCYSKGYCADAPERGLAVIKQEQLYGQYTCYDCNITMNSEATFQSHIIGRRHQKTLNAKNVVAVVSKTIDATTKCPRPQNGFRRVLINARASIQHLLDEQTQVPYPGLGNVTEIHGVTETTYYCSLCDAPCSANSIIAHLNGFKHQLNCLKKFRFELYEKLKYKLKHQIENQVANALMAVEKKHGRGLVKVERDILEGSNFNPELAMATSREMSLPSTSQQGAATDFSENYILHSIPDPTKPGFYCRLCESHSNSPQMWHNHIVGKKHLANVKKAPGATPSKKKYVPAYGVSPHLDSVLRDIDPPVVGLSQVREIRKPDINAISYNCFLCCCYLSSLEIVDHILSRKHREKYLESIDYPHYGTLRNCQLTDTASYDSLIEEMCETVEKERGRGTVEVYYAKNAVSK